MGFLRSLSNIIHDSKAIAKHKHKQSHNKQTTHNNQTQVPNNKIHNGRKKLK